MRKRMFAFLVTAILIPKIAGAQSPFYFKLDLTSSNVWSTTFLGLPAALVNSLLSSDDQEDIGSGSLGVHFRAATYRKGGKSMDVYGVNRMPLFKNIGHNLKQMVGFKAEDLFRDFEYSLKFGWQPVQVPVGFFARFGYHHESFRYFEEGDSKWIKHRMEVLRPGLGIRISPLENLIGENGWCPIIEIGSNYNFHVGYKGGYDNNKKELNDGLSTHAGIGIKTEGASIILDIERDHYELFNKDFEINGTKPYSDVTSNRWCITLSLAKDF